MRARGTTTTVLAMLLFACAGCSFVRDFDEFQAEGYEHSGYCDGIGEWPEEPDSRDEDGPPHTFALRGLTFRSGDWATTGYNVDGYCTTGRDPGARCSPVTEGDLSPVDGTVGRDNVFAQHVFGSSDLFGAFEQALRDGQAAGEGVLLVGLYGYDGSGGDSDVDVDVVVSSSSDGGGFTLRADSFRDGSAVISSRGIGYGAYVGTNERGTFLVAPLGTGRDAVMALPGPDAPVRMRFYEPTLVAELISDGDGGPVQMISPMVVGRWKLEDVESTARSFGSCFDAGHQMDLEDLLNQVADLPLRYGQMGTCDAISVGIGFQADFGSPRWSGTEDADPSFPSVCN